MGWIKTKNHLTLLSLSGNPDPGPDPDPGFWWPKIGKYTSELFYLLLMKNCNFLVPRLPTSKLLEKPSALKREHPALQKMKFINFFLFLWVIFALLGPDPGSPLNPDPDTAPDPDPQNCFSIMAPTEPVLCVCTGGWPAEEPTAGEGLAFPDPQHRDPGMDQNN